MLEPKGTLSVVRFVKHVRIDGKTVYLPITVERFTDCTYMQAHGLRADCDERQSANKGQLHYRWISKEIL